MSDFFVLWLLVYVGFNIENICGCRFVPVGCCFKYVYWSPVCDCFKGSTWVRVMCVRATEILIRNQWNMLGKMFINLHHKFWVFHFQLFRSLIFGSYSLIKFHFRYTITSSMRCLNHFHSLCFTWINQCFQWWIMFDRIVISMIKNFFLEMFILSVNGIFM